MNALVKEFEGRLETIKGWRQYLHKHPELSLEERQTAKYIADLVDPGVTTSPQASGNTVSSRL